MKRNSTLLIRNLKVGPNPKEIGGLGICEEYGNNGETSVDNDFE
jgi:hypothetical protein